MPTLPLPFVGPAYEATPLDSNAQTCVNLIPSLGGPGAKSEVSLIAAPGCSEWKYLGADEIRGQIKFGDNLYVVTGNTLWKITTAKVVTEVDSGTITTLTGRVTMAENGVRILICDGTKGYLTDGITLDKITDGSMPNATECVSLGSHFIVNNPAIAGRFLVSVPGATSVSNFIGANGNAFATAERRPDGLVTIAEHGDFLYLLGEESTEIWRQDGKAIMPFQWLKTIEYGCSAAASVAHTKDNLIWMLVDHTGDRGIVTIGEKGLRRLSTPAIDQRIRELAELGQISDATAYTYSMDGMVHYVINFPQANGGDGETWSVELTTGWWARRAWWDDDRAVYLRHRADAAIHFADRTLLSDSDTGRILELDPDLRTELGGVQRCERRAPFVYEETVQRLFYSKLALDMKTGVGTEATPAPVGMIRWSDDGGYNWSNVKTVPLGVKGDFAHRTFLDRLGSAKESRVFELVVTDPVPVQIMGATLTVDA